MPLNLAPKPISKSISKLQFCWESVRASYALANLASHKLVVLLFVLASIFVVAKIAPGGLVMVFWNPFLCTYDRLGKF